MMKSQQDTGRTIAAVVLIGVGGLFLLGQVFDFSILGTLWPLFVMFPGIVFLSVALRSEDSKTAGFIFPGLIITGTGLILMYQSITDHWESWAYIWTLYPVMVGMGLRFMNRRGHDDNAGKVGSGLIIGGLVAFVALAALFELLIFNGVGLGIIAPLIPLAMIAVGVYLLFQSQSDGKAKRKSHDV